MISSRFGNIIRKFSTSAVRQSGKGGIPGENLPFDIDNRYKLTLIYILFFGSGLALPFVALRHQLLKR